jgi:hypothetical protein
MKNIIFVLLIFLPLFSGAQIITTIAGSPGTYGYTGDGGAATSAKLAGPYGVAVDRWRNVYIADGGNSVIRKVDTNGTITTVAGNGIGGRGGYGGAATSAYLSLPSGVAIDSIGKFFICDYGNSCIRVVDTSGIINTYAGDGIDGYCGDNIPALSSCMESPYGIALDSRGHLFIADHGNQRVREVLLNDTIITFAGTGAPGFSGDSGAATAAKIYTPDKVAVDKYGNVYFADQSNMRVRKVDTNGIITTIAGTGAIGYNGDSIAATSAKLNYPAGIAVDDYGNVYIADMYNSRIRKVDTSGMITTIAGNGVGGYGGDGHAADSANLYWPTEVAISPSGNIYICDFRNQIIRAINNVPSFARGLRTTLNICKNSGQISIDSILTVTDADSGSVEKWTVANSPSHGSLSGFSRSARKKGSVFIPDSVYYTPTAGYVGTDSFKIKVSDNISPVYTTVVVTVHAYPNPGTIVGYDTICLDGPLSFFTDSVTGGKWSSSDTAVATISSTGTATGRAIGKDTIIYTVTDVCTSQAFLYAYVTACPDNVNTVSGNNGTVVVYPNPADDNARIVFPHTIQSGTIRIYNNFGQLIRRGSFSNSSHYTVGALGASGLYYFELIDNSLNQRFTGKFVYE